MKINKKIVIAGVAVAAVAVIGVGAFMMFSGNDNTNASSDTTVYVESIATICGLDASGVNERYSGVVESQEIIKIQLPSDKKVDEIFVSVGDEVKKGDKLFSYDLVDLEESLAEAQLEYDQAAADIEQAKKDIETLTKQKAEASADAQLQYTTKISTLENSIKRKELSQKSQENTINQLKESIQNSEVTSDLAGVIKTISKTDSDSDSSMDDSDAFMTIMKIGDYRIKGVVNEQNTSQIIEGDPVIIRSRVDDTIWRGSLTSVDTDNPEKNENDYYYDNSSSSGSTNYPFYVNLEDPEGLMMGQHVYIEMDNGQEDKKDGIWLESYYIVQEEGATYVWAATAKDKLEKKVVVLGEYDSELDQYEITAGLTTDDYIAFPTEELAVGLGVERSTGMFEDEDVYEEGMEDVDYGDGEDVEFIDDEEADMEDET